MMRALLPGFVLLLVACGHKSPSDSVCANQVPPPEACSATCDPFGDAICPAGFHCTDGGKCDAVCTQGGSECDDGESCSPDGNCVPEGTGSGSDMPPPDMNCPAVHVTATPTTPTVELLLDQSGTMTAGYGNTTRWIALRNALVAPANAATPGVVATLANRVVFGATLYSNRSHPEGGREVGNLPCPTLTSRPRVLNNFTAIQQLLTNNAPDEDTPTPESIDAIRMSFATNPPAQGSPPIIVLATDGLPDTCADADPPAGARQTAANAASVAAAQRAYAAGIKLFFLFVGDDAAGDHPKQMANAGAGQDPATGNAPFYVATNPADLTAAFNTIIGGVLSCDLKLNGQVAAEDAPNGTVLLNGANLTYGTDWTLDPDGLTIHLLGNACTTLKSATAPTVDATFPCGSVIF